MKEFPCNPPVELTKEDIRKMRDSTDEIINQDDEEFEQEIPWG